MRAVQNAGGNRRLTKKQRLHRAKNGAVFGRKKLRRLARSGKKKPAITINH
jgi:hypothetical protein